jgi:hypothetical protein
MKLPWLLVVVMALPLGSGGSAQAQPPATEAGAAESYARTQPVTCRVFGDGYAYTSAPADAVYIRAPRQGCIPDGTPTGTCRKWFGRCETRNGRKVLFKVFDDGDTNQSWLADAVYVPQPNRACIPDGTALGTCRRWFGLAETQDGRRVECFLFNDGYTNMTGPTRAIYFRSNGQVCLPDGTPTGTCRKWFGRCRAR